MKKKIAFVSTNDHVPWGGSEVLWSETALRLLKLSTHSVAFGVRRWKPWPSHVRSLVEAGARLYPRRMAIPPTVLGKYAGIPIRLFAKFWRYPILTRYRPDLAILSLGDHNSGGDWMRVCRQLRTPYAILVQLVKEAHIPSDYSPAYRELRKGYLRAERVFCVSSDNLDLLRTQFGDELANAELVSNPIRSSSHVPPWPGSEEVYRLAMVANLDINHKGHDLLFHVLRQPKWAARPLRVNIYGTGIHSELLRNLAEWWELSQTVQFMGFESSVEAIWSVNHGLVLPSRMEGLSLALLESMAAARIAIATRVGDSSRLIEDNVSGFLAGAPTVESLDETLERAWARRADWRTMGLSARARVQEVLPADPVGAFATRIERLLD